MASLRVAPRFVTAQSKEGLTRAILTYQLRRSATVRVINILQDLETNEWVAWFYDDDLGSPRMPIRRSPTTQEG